jgi:TonB family protein
MFFCLSVTATAQKTKKVKDGDRTFINTANQVLSEKHYSENKKIGIWKFHTRQGSLEWSYNFNVDTGSNSKRKNIEYLYLAENGEWIKEKADKDPVWLVGTDEWQHFLMRNLKYPQKAIDGNIQGTPLVEITVNENGDAIEYAISKSAHQALDNEAMRVYKLFDPEFVPAVKNGKKVKTKVLLPVVFRLE